MREPSENETCEGRRGNHPSGCQRENFYPCQDKIAARVPAEKERNRIGLTITIAEHSRTIE